MKLEERIKTIKGNENIVKEILNKIFPDSITTNGDFELTAKQNGEGNELEIYPTDKRDIIVSTRIQGSGICHNTLGLTSFNSERGYTLNIYYKNRD